MIHRLRELEVVIGAEFEARQRRLGGGLVDALFCARLVGHLCRRFVHPLDRFERLGFGRVRGAAFEMALEIGLAHERRRAPVVHGDVGLDALRLDRASRRRVVARRRELQPGVVAERENRLHRPFAERLPAEHRRALVVLQRAGDDFRRGGGAPVNQHDHRHLLYGGRQVLEVVLAAARVVFLAGGKAHLGFRSAAVGVDDERVLGEERRGDCDRLVEEATRVAPHVEHETLELALLVEVLQRLREVVGRAVLELADPDVAVPRLQHFCAHALDVDFLAGQRERERTFGVLAHDGQHDLRAGLAAHLFDRLVERHAAGGVVVDLDDQVSRLDPRAEGRRVLDRRDDAHQAVLDADLDAEAAELALRGDLQILERFGVEEIGMRVEPVHHSVDRLLDELVVGDGLDVVALDLAEDCRQQLQVLVGNRHPRVPLRDRREIEREQDA